MGGYQPNQRGSSEECCPTPEALLGRPVGSTYGQTTVAVRPGQLCCPPGLPGRVTALWGAAAQPGHSGSCGQPVPCSLWSGPRQEADVRRAQSSPVRPELGFLDWNWGPLHFHKTRPF